jgi:hypothetical protein
MTAPALPTLAATQSRDDLIQLIRDSLIGAD